MDGAFGIDYLGGKEIGNQNNMLRREKRGN